MERGTVLREITCWSLATELLYGFFRWMSCRFTGKSSTGYLQDFVTTATAHLNAWQYPSTHWLRNVHMRSILSLSFPSVAFGISSSPKVKQPFATLHVHWKWINYLYQTSTGGRLIHRSTSIQTISFSHTLHCMEDTPECAWCVLKWLVLPGLQISETIPVMGSLNWCKALA